MSSDYAAGAIAATFLERLKSLAPSLGPKEIQVCAALRLNPKLTRSELALLLKVHGTTLSAMVRRIRQALNLAANQHLGNFLAGI
jgi:DNA-binding MarR family transcriptional regulator